MVTLLIALLVAVAVPYWCVRFVLRPVTPVEVRAWAAAYGLTLTPLNGPVVLSFLVRAQRWRRTAVLLAYVVVPSVTAAGFGVQLDTPLLLGMLAYSGAMVAAAATMPNPLVGVAAAADLSPRTVGRYLPLRLRWIPRVLAGCVVGAALWSLQLVDPEGVVGINSSTIVFYGIVVSLGLLLAGEVVLAAVVGHRQPAGPADLVAADDAIRAQLAHAIAAAVISGEASLLLPALTRATLFDEYGPWVDIVAYAGPIVGLLVGLWYTGRAWPVRRPTPGSGVAAAAGT